MGGGVSGEGVVVVAARRRLVDIAEKEIFAVKILGKVKIVFGFYQVCLVLSTSYSARLPERYTGWTDTLSQVISIDWSGFYLPPQCLPYWSRLVAVTVLPIGVIALLLCAGVGLRIHHRRASRVPRTAISVVASRDCPWPPRPHAGQPPSRVLLCALR